MNEKELREELNKNVRIAKLFQAWMIDMTTGMHVGDFLIRNGFTHVAIYGYGLLGKALYSVLVSEGIEDLYVIDRDDQKWDWHSNAMFYKPQDIANMEHVDAVIITPITYSDDIYKMLASFFTCPIFLLEDLV